MKKPTSKTPNHHPTHYVSIVHRREKVRPNTLPEAEAVDRTEEENTASSYRVARIIARIIAFMGWVSFVLGFVVMGYAVAHIDGTKNLDVILVIVLPGLGMNITGLFLIVAGQITRAMVNNATDTRRILLHLKSASETGSAE